MIILDEKLKKELKSWATENICAKNVDEDESETDIFTFEQYCKYTWGTSDTKNVVFTKRAVDNFKSIFSMVKSLTFEEYSCAFYRKFLYYCLVYINGRTLDNPANNNIFSTLFVDYFYNIYIYYTYRNDKIIIEGFRCDKEKLTNFFTSGLFYNLEINYKIYFDENVKLINEMTRIYSSIEKWAHNTDLMIKNKYKKKKKSYDDFKSFLLDISFDDILFVEKMDREFVFPIYAILYMNCRYYTEETDIAVEIETELKKYCQNFPGAIDEWNSFTVSEQKKPDLLRFTEETVSWLKMKTMLYKSVIDCVDIRAQKTFDAADELAEKELEEEG